MDARYSEKPHSVRAFASSLFFDLWDYLIYGFGAVILTYWAYATKDTPPAWVFLLVVALAFFIGAYRTWKRERIERNDFAILLAPRLVIDFDPARLGFLETTRESNSGVQMLFIHVLPRCLGAAVTDCRGFITGISARSSGNAQWTPVFVHQVPLYWSGHEEGPTGLTLYEDASQFLDVAYTVENEDYIRLVHPRATLLNTMPAIISRTDIFKVDILVAGDHDARASISLELQPTNVWAAPNVRRL